MVKLSSTEHLTNQSIIQKASNFPFFFSTTKQTKQAPGHKKPQRREKRVPCSQ
jgi:hypothetical protein